MATATEPMHIAHAGSLWIALLVGLASGSIGPFILLRRMALVGDALSHVALPGIALALIYRLDPFVGVLVFQLAAAFAIFWLEKQSELPPDSIVGLLFTASLAIGILMLPPGDIMESLFGALPALSRPALIAFLASAAGLAALCFVLARRFTFLIVSPDLARVQGLGSRTELALLAIFAVIVALGIKLVGVLLMGALTIIPAALARNLTRSMRSYVIASALAGGAVAVAGVFIASEFEFLPGPTIVLLGAAAFLVSLALGRRATA